MSMNMNNQDFASLERMAGISFVGVNPVLREKGVAYDAQPAMVTTGSSGIPAFLSTLVDPKIIEVALSPMKCFEIVGDETKKGDFFTPTIAFSVIETTGVAVAYGDFNEGGNSGANLTFPQRQSFHYQTTTVWGEQEMGMAGLAKIDWASRQSIASVQTLNRKQNQTYFFGVSGLANYGLLNDPSLPSAIVPTTKVAGGALWLDATGLEVVADIAKLYTQVLTQSKGLVNRSTPMTLAMSNLSEANGMLKPSAYMNTNVSAYLKTLYPNMTIQTAPEYSTAAGELVQLIVNEMEGQKTRNVGHDYFPPLLDCSDAWSVIIKRGFRPPLF
jgi:hypothetical protein